MVKTEHAIHRASVAESTALAINAGEAVAYAMRQIEPEVAAAYPITPQTLIIEKFSEYCAEGTVRTEFVTVESEHAALSACIGASVAGGRAVTATAGPGLALMFEVLGVTAGMRLPVVMHLCTRSLSAPIDILCDHSDAMAMRESGWVMLVGSSPQEAYDQAVMAHRIAEHPDVLLPFANVLDGFVVTHAVERVDVLPDGAVKRFVGEYSPDEYALKPGSETTFGAIDFRDYYFEHKRQQHDAMERALPVTEAVLREFGDLSGRRYEVIEPYRLDDAEVALVLIGSAVGTVRAAVDEARESGLRAGALQVRLFRPFPSAAVAEYLEGVAAVGVLDRALGYGAPADPLLLDVSHTLQRATRRPLLKGFVYGLGGRVTTQRMFGSALTELGEAAAGGKIDYTTSYLGLREDASQ